MRRCVIISTRQRMLSSRNQQSYNEMPSETRTLTHTETHTSFIYPLSVLCVRLRSSEQQGSRAPRWPGSVSAEAGLVCAGRGTPDKSSPCCQFNYSPYYCRQRLFSLSRRTLSKPEGDGGAQTHLVGERPSGEPWLVLLPAESFRSNRLICGIEGEFSSSRFTHQLFSGTGGKIQMILSTCGAFNVFPSWRL